MFSFDSLSLPMNVQPGDFFIRLNGRDDREHVEQKIRLVFTEPHYGGRRWWMVCPYRHIRAAKLYMPNGGDRFASRKAWRLAYQSQRVAHRDRAFEKLFRLQRKLGCEQGYDSFIRRPKGMWHRTFDRPLERFEELDAVCGAEMAMLIPQLHTLAVRKLASAAKRYLFPAARGQSLARSR